MLAESCEVVAHSGSTFAPIGDRIRGAVRKLLLVHPPAGADASDLEFARCQLDALQRNGADLEALILAPGWHLTVVTGDEVLVRLKEIDG